MQQNCHYKSDKTSENIIHRDWWIKSLSAQLRNIKALHIGYQKQQLIDLCSLVNTIAISSCSCAQNYQLLSFNLLTFHQPVLWPKTLHVLHPHYLSDCRGYNHKVHKKLYSLWIHKNVRRWNFSISFLHWPVPHSELLERKTGACSAHHF